jgi:MFS family permease
MGEASNMAPASALIGDTFGGRYRVLAMAVFAAGGPVAIMICYPIIGRITAEQGWRAAYAFMGLAGLGVATLTLLIVRESRVDPAHGRPERRPRRTPHQASGAPPGRWPAHPALPCYALPASWSV